MNVFSIVSFASSNGLLFYTATNSLELSTPLPTKVHTPCRALCGVASEWPQPWQGSILAQKLGARSCRHSYTAGRGGHIFRACVCAGSTSGVVSSSAQNLSFCCPAECCPHDGGIRKGEKDTAAVVSLTLNIFKANSNFKSVFGNL